jgi:hypothetical protein
MTKFKTLLFLTVGMITAILSAGAQTTNSAPPPPTVVATGTITGSPSGLANFGTDLYNFIAPNSSNGLFNADEFDVDALGVITHTESVDKLGKTHSRRDFGADLGLSYFFTTGLGSRFDIQYANGQATYTSLAGVARTTFGNSSNLVMISPYIALIASHGIGSTTGAFNSGIGFGAEVPFHIKKLQGRFIAEVDTKSQGQPDYKFGLNFNWQKK